MVTSTVEFVVVDGRPAVRGACDSLNASEIEAWLARFDGVPIEVDLSAVTSFDSTVLAVFLRAIRRNPKLRVVKPSPFVLRILESTNTSTLSSTVETSSTAGLNR